MGPVLLRAASRARPGPVPRPRPAAIWHGLRSDSDGALRGQSRRGPHRGGATGLIVAALVLMLRELNPPMTSLREGWRGFEAGLEGRVGVFLLQFVLLAL